MQRGIIAENEWDRLENKLCGVGRVMQDWKFPHDSRMIMARAIGDVLDVIDPHNHINHARVFSRFFGVGELSEMHTKLSIAP